MQYREMLLAVVWVVLFGGAEKAQAYWAQDYEWAKQSSLVDVRYADDMVYMLGSVQEDPRFIVVMAVKLSGGLVWSRWLGPVDGGAKCLEKVQHGLVVVGQSEADDPDYDAVVVARLDLDGNLEWSRTYEIPDRHNLTASDIVRAGGDDVIIVGDAYDAVRDNWDSWAMRLDPWGNPMWHYTYFHTSRTQERARGIDFLEGRNKFIMASNWREGGSSNTNFWLTELNPDGDLITHKNLYPPQQAYLREIKYVSNNGEYAITGVIYDPVDGWDILALQDVATSAGLPDWAYRFGVDSAPRTDVGYDLVQSHNGDLIIGGYSMLHTPHRASGALLRLRWWDGVKIWERHYGNNNHHDLFTALDRTEGSDFAAVGYNQSFGATVPEWSAWAMSLDANGNFSIDDACVEVTTEMHRKFVGVKVHSHEQVRHKPELQLKEVNLQLLDEEPDVTHLCP